MIRAFLLTVPVALGLAASPPLASAECLPMDQVRATMRAGKVLPLIQAVNAARSAAPGEVIDSRLCGGPDKLRYVVTLLSQDGRVVRVTVDAQSGAVIAVK